MSEPRKFIDLMPPLPSAAEMRQWDKAAIDFGIPENMLMENAARAALSVIREHFHCLYGIKFWLFMGKGNNGGDAAALAVNLASLGADCALFTLSPPGSFSGSPAFYLNLALKSGVKIFDLENYGEDSFLSILFRLAQDAGAPHMLIDGLLGTGFQSPLRDTLARLIQAINMFSCLFQKPVFSLDIPSGLNADSGIPASPSIQASTTITFAAAKPGLALPWGRVCAGSVRVVDIGIPIPDKMPSSTRLLDGRIFTQKHAKIANSFKNTYGHTLIIGGSRRYSGAARIAGRAALRAGAGLVTVVTPEQSIVDIKSDFPEVMVFSIGASWPDTINAELEELLTHANSLVIGPGMGRDQSAGGFLSALLQFPGRPPAIIDADAIFHLSRHPELFSAISPKDITTPHPGEAAMLLGSNSHDVQADRRLALEKICSLASWVVTLKGAGTLVGKKGAPILLSPYDIPQLAIGGAGDALSGCLGALLAWHGALDSLEIAGTGVAAHAIAGLILKRRYPNRGALASELADSLAQVRAFIDEQDRRLPPDGFLPWPE